jgi:hypothetical protein
MANEFAPPAGLSAADSPGEGAVPELKPAGGEWQVRFGDDPNDDGRSPGSGFRAEPKSTA